MTLEQAKAALKAAQADFDQARADVNAARQAKNRRAIMDAETRLDVAGEKLREARERLISSALGE